MSEVLRTVAGKEKAIRKYELEKKKKRKALQRSKDLRDFVPVTWPAVGTRSSVANR